MIMAGLAVLLASTMAQVQGTGAPARAEPLAARRPTAAVRLLSIPAGAVRLDGHLDEPEWSRADSITDLRQREPTNGAPGSERTVIRVLGTPDALYISVRAYDRAPTEIRATQFRRDATLDADDHVTLLIDSFRESRGAFLFRTNPNGARWDAQQNGAEDSNANWNGIWDVAATRDSLGWTAEFQIPFATLRFHPGATAFGFNVERVIRRRNEESLWQSWGRAQGISQLLNVGEIQGIPPLTRGVDLELRPYLLGRVNLDEYDLHGTQVADGGFSAKAGIDAKLAVTPTLTADLTLNTDFAQVESDQQLINLTQFPLFFPEKREFFLESSGLFEFGTQERAQLFYSRRIGVKSGEAVPIIGGARMYGKVGPWAVGLLGAHTGEGEDATDLVLRVKHDLFDRSYVGAMATQRTTPEGVGAEQAIGVDIDLPLIWNEQNIEPSFWLAGTRLSGAPGTPTAWRAAVDYPNDLFDNFVSLYRIEEGFRPALGYVRESGIWETTGHVTFQPRPTFLGIRQLELKLIPSWDIVSGVAESLLQTSDWRRAKFEFRPLGGEFQNGDQFEVNLQRVLDTSLEGFELFPGTVVPPGRYWWTRGEVQYESSTGRPLSVKVQASAGGFYSGTNTEMELGMTWRSGGKLIASAAGALSAVRLPTGNFNATEVSSRVEYAFNTRADVSAFVQYNNEDQAMEASLRFHWIPTIGDDLYVVWNSGYTTDQQARWRFPSWGALRRPLEGGLVVKAVHRIVP